MLNMMTIIGEYMSSNFGATLVSGHAQGADQAFERGCDVVRGKKEIWMPELGFEGGTSKLLPSKEAFKVAEIYVGHWKNCGKFARNCHARNAHQVLGADLRSPVNFIVAWTPDGKLEGGTATALKIGKAFDIPILNMGEYEAEDELEYKIGYFLEENAVKPVRKIG